MASVLVIDDDKAARDALRLVPEVAGNTVAADGLAALISVTTVATELSIAAWHRFILVTAVAPKRAQQTDEIHARTGVPVLLKPCDVAVQLRTVALACSGTPLVVRAGGHGGAVGTWRR